MANDPNLRGKIKTIKESICGLAGVLASHVLGGL